MVVQQRTKKKLLYLLRGAEWILAPCVVATRLTITEMGPAIPPESTMLARGHIWLTDLVEDTKWQDAWEALWVLPEPEIVVSGHGGVDTYRQWYNKQRAEERPLGWRVFKRDSVRADFTLAKDVNDAIAMFVALHLCWYSVWIGDDGRMPHMLRTPKRYSGPMKRYEGICLCGVIQQSGPHHPFPWQTVTNGQFPQRCFQCSCSRTWWEVDPEERQWFPVGDPPTWRCLTQHNGEPVKHLCFFAGTVRLLGPLVHRGAIPIALPFCEPEKKILTP